MTTNHSMYSYELSGEAGNAFAVISFVCGELVESGDFDRANAFMEAAFAARSYDEVLRLATRFIDIKFMWHRRPFPLVMS